MTNPTHVSGTIKPLEWHDNVAETPFGSEFFDTDGLGSSYNGVRYLSPDHERDAKAAAQADYEARILASIQPEAPGGWQPIDTAPTDGTDILLYQDGWAINPVIVGRNVDGTWLSDSFSIDDEDQQPTHWMPLPEPPK